MSGGDATHAEAAAAVAAVAAAAAPLRVTRFCWVQELALVFLQFSFGFCSRGSVLIQVTKSRLCAYVPTYACGARASIFFMFLVRRQRQTCPLRGQGLTQPLPSGAPRDAVEEWLVDVSLQRRRTCPPPRLLGALAPTPHPLRCNVLLLTADVFPQAEVFASDCMRLPFRSGVFDAAISIAVLHHFSSEVRVCVTSIGSTNLRDARCKHLRAKEH